MKKVFFFLIPILVITALYFAIRFLIDTIIEMDDEGSVGE
jgi:hypothetical protein